MIAASTYVDNNGRALCNTYIYRYKIHFRDQFVTYKRRARIMPLIEGKTR